MQVFIISVPLEAVTVNPGLCPTNKIAPYRRSAGWDEETPRTFGAYYDLLFVPSNQQQFAPQSSLQEEPQKDELDDCGDIEDYDENDLSSCKWTWWICTNTYYELNKNFCHFSLHLYLYRKNVLNAQINSLLRYLTFLNISDFSDSTVK